MTIRAIWGYKGGEYDERIAEIYSLCNCIYYSPDACRLVNSEYIRRIWYEATWFKPDEHFLLFLQDKLVGYSYAWVVDNALRINACIDPTLPDTLKEDLFRTVIRESMKKKLDEYKHSIITIHAGREFSELHQLIRKIVSPIRETITSQLMKLCIDELERYVEKKKPPSIKLVESNGVEHADIITEIFNNAFSIYDWFIEWNPEDTRRWYEQQKLTVFIAYNEKGEPIGYSDISIRKNYYGETIGYIETLAVKKEYQRKGYGTALIYQAVRELLEKGIEKIYLDAVYDVATYYYKRGFKPLYRYIRAQFVQQNV